MARKHSFLGARFTKQWEESYEKLQNDQRRGTDKVVMAIIKGEMTPGMEPKPIEPSKYYNAARINSGDRVVYRIEDGLATFNDIVPHDLINKYAHPRKSSP